MIVFKGYAIWFAHWQERQGFIVSEDRSTIFIQGERDLELARNALERGRGPRGADQLWWITLADRLYGATGWTFEWGSEIDWPTAMTLVGGPEAPVQYPLVFDPVSGQPIMYYTGADAYRDKHELTWMYNPWTGQHRPTYATINDPQGLLVTPLDQYDLREQGRQ